MADFYSSEAPARTTKPTVARAANAVSAKLRRTVSTFVCDGTNVGAAAIASRLLLPRVPKGARGVKHRITVSATLGTATLALGIAGNTSKYAAAATYTAPTRRFRSRRRRSWRPSSQPMRISSSPRRRGASQRRHDHRR
jgi:hypothetical protein